MLTDFDDLRRNGSSATPDTMRRDLSEWVCHFHPRWMLTFNFNADVSVAAAHRKMRQCLMRVEHAKFGRNWSKQPVRVRLKAIAFMEHSDSNVHWHCAVRTLFGDWEEALEAGQRHWETLVPSGSLHIARAGDIEGLASYMTKEQYTGAHLDAMFFYAPERSPCLVPKRP